MKTLSFSKEETALLADKIRRYFHDELDQEIGALPAEFFLEFIVREIAPAIYNRGLNDAHAAISARIDELSETIYAMELPIPDNR